MSTQLCVVSQTDKFRFDCGGTEKAKLYRTLTDPPTSHKVVLAEPVAYLHININFMCHLSRSF